MPKKKPLDRNDPASKLGRLKRRKGQSFEREKARALRCVYPHAVRGLGQARAKGEVSDIEKTPWWMELKHHKVVNIRAAMEQALSDTAKHGQGRRPVVISRNTGRTPDLVTMTFDDWLALVGEVESWRREEARRILDEP